MTDFVFVDTNVLIYARDRKSVEKRGLARSWLSSLAEREAMRLNLQVINELTRWLLANERSRPMSDIREEIDTLRHWGDHPLTPDDVDQAWILREALGFHWLDCLLVSAAERLGCRFFLTEDMTDRARFGSITLINPFRMSPSDLLQPH